jgi:tetratricopeptide (TPR) repeat protein
LLWQQAEALRGGGTFLSDDVAAPWREQRIVRRKQEKIDRARRQMLRGLGLSVLALGDAEKAHEYFCDYFQELPSDFHTLETVMELMVKQKRPDLALGCYELVEEKVRTGKSPFPLPLSVQKCVNQLRHDFTTSSYAHEKYDIQWSSSSKLEVPYGKANLLPPGLWTWPPISEEMIVNGVTTRRSFLQDTIYAACTSFVLSSATPSSAEMIWRIEKAVHHPATLDTTVVQGLETITQTYWSLSKNTSSDILSGVVGHFSTIAQLLKGATTKQYAPLCSLASQVAQIIGKTLCDLQEYSLAYPYYVFSLKTAQAASHPELYAVGLGRIALLFIASTQPEKALPFLEEAKKSKVQNARIQAWLAAVEAEAFAYLRREQACFSALGNAMEAFASREPSPDHYCTGLTPSRLRSYHGICLMLLGRSQQAVTSFQEALQQAEQTALRHQSRISIDLGKALLLLGEKQSAAQYAYRALELVKQTRSLQVLQRLESLNIRLQDHELQEQIQKTHQMIKAEVL